MAQTPLNNEELGMRNSECRPPTLCLPGQRGGMKIPNSSFLIPNSLCQVLQNRGKVLIKLLHRRDLDLFLG